jgi:hypothetical protein
MTTTTKKPIKKLIRDTKVAVIFSPGRGRGWYTAHGIDDLLFDGALAKMIVQKYEEAKDDPVSQEIINIQIDQYLSKNYPDITQRGPFAIAWIEQGEQFYIHEYEGFETIRLLKNMQLITA